ncbi:MAG: YncE family protein [Sphingomonadaceae bacterium]
MSLLRPATLALTVPLAVLASCMTAHDEAGGAAGADGAAVFVANKRGNTLTRIALTSGDKTAEVDSCTNPHELATSPDGRHVALACYGGTTVALFDTATLATVTAIDLGERARPHGIEWHANGSIYVTAEGRQSIFRIVDPLGAQPDLLEYSTGQPGSHMLTVSPDGRYAWTTDLGAGTVTLVDLVTRRAPRSVKVGLEPEGIDLSPDGKALWVSARRSDKAIELDPMTLEVRREVLTGRFPLRLAIRPQGDVAVTSNLADGSLSVVDLARAETIRTITVSTPDEAAQRQQVTILWSGDGQRIYVAETGTNTVAEVDYASGMVLRRLAAGEGGDGLAILPQAFGGIR